jgi:hypothetical protein
VPAGVKRQTDEGDGGILLGDDAGDGEVVLRPIWICMLQSGFLLDSLLCKCTLNRMCTEFRLAPDFPEPQILCNSVSVCICIIRTPLIAISCGQNVNL